MTVDTLPPEVHVIARPAPGKLILPGQCFTAIVHGQRVATYRQRFTYLGRVATDPAGRHWMWARRTSNSAEEWVPYDAVTRVHRRLP